MALLFSPLPAENLAKFTRDEISYLTNGGRCRFVRVYRYIVRVVYRLYIYIHIYTNRKNRCLGKKGRYLADDNNSEGGRYR